MARDRQGRTTRREGAGMLTGILTSQMLEVSLAVFSTKLLGEPATVPPSVFTATPLAAVIAEAGLFLLEAPPPPPPDWAIPIDGSPFMINLPSVTTAAACR
jgi:hypothetical protein